MLGFDPGYMGPEIAEQDDVQFIAEFYEGQRGVESTWLRCVREKLIRLLGEHVPTEVPSGIGLGEVL